MSCSEWKQYSLGDICENIFSGGTPSTKNTNYWNGSIPWLSSGETINNFINSTEKTITLDGVNNSSTKLAKKGDIVIASAGQGYTRGQTSFCNIDTYINQSLIAIRTNNAKIHNKYLYYNLKGRYDELRQLSDGHSIRGSLTTKIIKDLVIKLPSLEEQEKIANILSSLDDKIELNNEMNKTLEEMAQSIFKRWFVDFEFPNEDGQPYKSSGGEMVESELGMIPKGWEYGVINDTCEKIYSGGTPKTSEETYWNGELNWMSSGETRNNFIIDTEKYITQQGADKSSTKLANRLNTVIASAGQGFTRGQTSLLLIDTYINQSLITLKPKYYYEFFNYFNIKRRYDELRNISDSHSIRGSLTTKMICKLGTILPSIEVLKEFCVIIEPIIIQIENNIRNSQNIEELRNQLLPKLMNGEIKFQKSKYSIF